MNERMNGLSESARRNEWVEFNENDNLSRHEGTRQYSVGVNELGMEGGQIDVLGSNANPEKSRIM